MTDTQPPGTHYFCRSSPSTLYSTSTVSRISIQLRDQTDIYCCTCESYIRQVTIGDERLLPIQLISIASTPLESSSPTPPHLLQDSYLIASRSIGPVGTSLTYPSPIRSSHLLSIHTGRYSTTLPRIATTLQVQVMLPGPLLV
jgi:hypothetical protein